jgi:hypothetical protein
MVCQTRTCFGEFVQINWKPQCTQTIGMNVCKIKIKKVRVEGGQNFE